MKKYFLNLLFLSIILLGSFGLSNQVNAAYKYSIICNPGEVVALVVNTKDGNTSGSPDFEPNKGKEICLLSSGSLADQIKAKKISGVYFNKTVRIEYNDCSQSETGYATYSWIKNSDYKATDSLIWQKDYPGSCSGVKKRRRYRIGNIDNFYIIGPWKKSGVNTNTNVDAVTQLCSAFKKSSECNANPNCTYYQTCKPTAIAQADKKKTIDNIGKADPSQQIVCSSVLEKIKSQCANDPDLCASTCNVYQNTCIYFNNSCVQKNTLSPEQLRTLTIEAADSYLKEKYKTPSGYLSKILPACAFSGTCRSLQDLLILGINIAQFLFSLIGTIAFVMFVYGGFRMMLSMGRQDGIQQGKDAMVHAVIGIVISFSAYLIISFVLNILNVGSDFRAIGMIIKYLV